MKKAIGFIFTWLCYYLGDLVSRVPNFNYNIYSKLMIWSADIQDWSNCYGPWKSPERGTFV